MMSPSLPNRVWMRGLIVVGVGVAALVIAGCASSESPTFSDDPTTRAMADPMAYSPNMDNPDITGGGLTNFDSKAFKKDVDDVFNP
jgi:hypothetical protein